MSYKLAIFDMDGTILNTLDDLADSMNHSLATFGLPLKTVDEVRSYVGNGIRKAVERAVPKGLSVEQIDEVHDEFRRYYKDHCAIKTRPYDGILEVIKTLRERGILTAVVSNKAEFAVQSLCVDYFDGLFDCYVGDKEGQRRKPYPDGVLSVLDKLGIAKEDAVYIGDSDVDFETAKNSEMDVIMVGWGFRDEEFIRSKGAEFVIHKPEEILKFF